MDILVLDIGCSNMKSIICRGNDLLEKTSVPTPQDAIGILTAANDLIGKASASGYELSAVIPTSFSESVIVEGIDGTLRLFGPVLPETLMREQRPSYGDTGYPIDSFVGVCRILRYLKSTHHSFRRALPVSAMIAVHLASNTDWKTWDYMHASNSGLYGNGKWIAAAEPYKDWLNIRETASPNTCVGKLVDGTPVFLGGHDSLFGIYPGGEAYVSCGTYITASEPAEFMKDSGENIRYVQDAHGTYHRQICFEASGHLSQTHALKIYEFLNAPLVKVFGSYANEMADMLNGYGVATYLPDVHNAQFRGAAQLIADAL